MQVFENSLWLFFTHPFDVGDFIKYHDVRYSVQTIKLQKVNMTRYDGAHVMIPTELLRSAPIHNITRCALLKKRWAMQSDFDQAHVVGIVHK
jgi:small-conductance mechanosensitive channel